MKSDNEAIESSIFDKIQNNWNACVKQSLEFMAVGRKSLRVSEDKEFYPNKCFWLYNDIPGKTPVPVGLRPGVGKALIPCANEFVIGDKIDPIAIAITGSFDVRAKPVFEQNEKVIDICLMRIKKDYERQENTHIFRALRLMAEHCKKITVIGKDKTYNQWSEQVILTSAWGDLVDGIPAKLIGSPKEVSEICKLSSVDGSTCRELLTTNLYGHILTADIHACPQVPDGELIVTDQSHNVGQMLILKPISTRISKVSEDMLKVSYSSTIAIGLYENVSFIFRDKSKPEWMFSLV